MHAAHVEAHGMVGWLVSLASGQMVGRGPEFSTVVCRRLTPHTLVD